VTAADTPDEGRQKKRLRRAPGRAATILTTPAGLAGAAPVLKPTLGGT